MLGRHHYWGLAVLAGLTLMPILGVLQALLMPSVSNSLQAAEPDAAVQQTFDKLTAAIQKNDREAFIADATDAVKKGVTPEIMDALSKQLRARLAKGFEATYLCQLKQQGHQVHLWKTTFSDGGDDVVIRIALKDGKVDGFFLQ